MKSILLNHLKRHAISISTTARFTTPCGNTRSHAIFQQIALYSNEHKRGRELVKFPWVWPSDSEQAPKKPCTHVVNSINKIEKFIIRASDYIGFKGTQLKAFGSLYYISMVRDEILPLVLSRIVDSINEKDYDQMNELMTPYLAKLYKNAIDDLDAQGYSMRLEIDVRESSPKNDYELAKYGDPDAYDYTIPYADRNFRYSMNRMGARLAIASRRNLHNKSAFRGPMRESGANAFNQWLAFEFGFIVDADVKVDLYKNNCIIDSDSGMMKIPIAISTPHLLGINGMAEAVSAGEKAEAEKPFEWRVCDLFYIADRNNANEIEKAKANEDTNK